MALSSTLLLFLCVCGSLTLSRATLTTSCVTNSSTRLEFITSMSVGGCPLFVHRMGSVKTGEFVVEPIFCFTNTEALTQASVHHDPLANQSYFSFPVAITDAKLLNDVRTQLRDLSPKSVSFLEVTDIRLATVEGSVYKAMGLVWDRTENVAHMRVKCNAFDCQSVALHLWSGQFELLDSLRLQATVQVHETCLPIERDYPVAIAHSPFLPIKSMQRPRTSDLRTCSDLKLFRVIQLEDCTAYVHQRESRKGHFVIEPLLCPSANFSLLVDYSLRRHYLRLPATVEDPTVVDVVRSRLSSASPQSVVFMQLWDATLHVTSRLSQWKIDPVRLSTDRKSAELRVYCVSQASCELLSSVLESEPINFWMNVQWTATSMISNKCEVKSEQRRFAFRMKDRTSKNTDLSMSPAIRWSAGTLRKKRVIRDGRNFIIVLQRGCEQSDFARYWNEYVNGFGDEENFWIGLEALHSLTNPQGATMRVEMRLWNGTEWFGEYSSFTVGNSSTNYRMNYTQMVRARSSLISDSMKHSKGFPFSTRDRENYFHSRNYYCSRSWGGYAGWWFRKCSHANPNGVYHHGESSSTAHSVWLFVEGFKSLKEFRMMIQL